MKITEQLWITLFSALMILIAAGAVVWLIATGGIAHIEGIFLLLVCGIMALVFGLTVRFGLKS